MEISNIDVLMQKKIDHWVQELFSPGDEIMSFFPFVLFLKLW